MIEKLLNQRLEELKLQLEDELDNFECAGIRFEDKSRKVGDTIREKSKHNIDREDERDFPDYGSDEYEEMQDLAGVSAWKLDEFSFDGGQNNYLADHCYLIASDDVTYDDGFLLLDQGEVILNNAKVLAVLF